MGQIAISAPLGVSINELDRALERRRVWIDRKLIAQKRYDHLTDPTHNVLFRGYLYSVQWHVGPGKSTLLAESEPRTIEIATNDGLADTALISAALRSESESIKPYVLHRADELDVAIKRVTLRNQATRWGSSSSIGTISINWRLIMAPDDVMRYLVVHELAHQRFMNHSKAFWNQVSAWCPGYREHDSWLKDHSFLLSLLR